jgi:hypothetical protein
MMEIQKSVTSINLKISLNLGKYFFEIAKFLNLSVSPLLLGEGSGVRSIKNKDLTFRLPLLGGEGVL